LKRVVFAGGGTGGHIYPAIAVADELRRRHPDIESIFVGTRSGLERRIVPEAGYGIEFIFAKGLRGRGLLGKFITIAGISIGVFQAISILTRLKPILVFGSGGFASAATLIAASLLRYPIAIQEQNSIPGLTNRMLARYARRVYTGFKMAGGYFKKHPGLSYTGNPLRSAFFEEIDCNPRAHFGLSEKSPVVLVFGGSRGAHSLNVSAVEMFKRMKNVQGIIQTGERDFEWVRKELQEYADRVVVRKYLDRIVLAYRASDIVVARAGALSVSEISCMRVPSILVPYPYAADDHQYFNARELADVGGCIVVRDKELSGEKLALMVEDLISDPKRLSRMREALTEVSVCNATERIVDDIEITFGIKG